MKKSTKKQTQSQALRLPDGRVVGEVRGDELVKRVTGSKHMLQKPVAWAVDETILRQAESLGAKKVKITDVETNKTYTAPVSTLWERGIRLNRGFGEQIALPIPSWLTDQSQCQLSLLELA